MPRRTWTDDDLRAAIASSLTWTSVLRGLGLAGRSGGSLTAARRRAEQLGLDTSHLPRRGGAAPRTWSDEELARAVAAATSLAGVFRELGLHVGGSAWQRMQEHIVRLELDTAHFTRRLPADRRRTEGQPAWSDEELRAALPGARSVSEVMRRLGIAVSSHAQRRRILDRIRALELPTDELAGRRWAEGLQQPGRRRTPLAQLLVAGREPGSTSGLKRRLIEEGVFEHRCSGCERTTWLGGSIPLQLDHVNGDRTDNRIENLRLLCPNCHALTDTYCGRNIGRR